MSGLDIPGYRDVQRVGSGGLGDVYRATRISTGGHVAVKVVREVGDREATDRRVRREVQALLQLKGHPNVVQIEELLTLPTGLALVMEYMVNGSLMDRLQTRVFSPAEAVFAIHDVAHALASAHAVGVVHRDIKPHNVLIGPFGTCKVCDFGIAAIARDSSYTDRTSALSFRYASPEELDESPAVGPPSDVYSLGVTMRHVLTGETNLARATEVSGRWPSELAQRPAQLAVATRMLAMIDAMTARRVEDRPSAREVQMSLAALRADLGTDAVNTLVAPLPGPNTPAGAPIADAADADDDDDDRTVLRPQRKEAPPSVRSGLPDPARTPREWWRP